MNDTQLAAYKAAWNQPGAGFAKFSAIALACGLGYGVYKALPFLIQGATNLLILMGEIGVIVLLFYIIFSKDTRRLLSLIWLQLNRWLVGKFVRIDPIAILEDGIREMQSKMKSVSDNVTTIQSNLEEMKSKLEEYKRKFKREMDSQSAAKKILSDPKAKPDVITEMKAKLITTNKNITRLHNLITEQTKRIQTSERYLNILKKLEVAAKYKVEDAENELEVQTEQFNQAKSQKSALRSISSIMNGGFAKSLEQEMALNYINTTINDSVAEMKRLIDGSNDLLATFELDTAADLERAEKIISAFEENGFSSFSMQDDDDDNIKGGYLPMASSYAQDSAKKSNDEAEEIPEPVLLSANHQSASQQEVAQTKWF